MRHSHKPKRAPRRSILAARATPCSKGGFRRFLGLTSSMPLVEARGGGSFGGSIVRIQQFFSVLAASAMAMAPVTVAAQTPLPDDPIIREDSVSVRDRDRPEYEPLGRRVGSFELNASLGLSVTSTDNLFVSRPALEVDEMFYEFAPQASLVSDWRRHAFALDGGWTMRRHQDEDREDTDAYFVRATGRVDVGANTALYASSRLAHQVTPRTDPDVSDTTGVPVEYDRFDASVGASHRFARATVRVDVGQSNYDYEGSQAFRDFRETFVRGRLDYEVSPRLTVIGQVRADDRNNNNTPTLSSEGRTILAGIDWTNDVVRGEFLVGQFERDYSGPAGTVDGVAAQAAVEWYITDLTTISLAGVRSGDDQTVGTSGVPYVTTEAGITVDHELLRNVILTAGYEQGQRDYDPSPRRDEYQHMEAGADWILNRRVALSARFERDELHYSGVSIDDRDANAIRFGVSFRL